MIKFWHWLVGHGPLVYERASDGTLLLVCPKCRAMHSVRLVTR